MAEVTIVLDGKEHIIEVNANEKILDKALKSGVDAPYSCRSAICSTCMAMLVEGKVDLEMNNVLTDEELEEGYIVTCQAKPVTDKVKISYDI